MFLSIKLLLVLMLIVNNLFLGCISLGKILIRILYPKTDFLFFGKIQKGILNPMNPCAMKIQWINPNPDS